MAVPGLLCLPWVAGRSSLPCFIYCRSIYCTFNVIHIHEYINALWSNFCEFGAQGIGMCIPQYIDIMIYIYNICFNINVVLTAKNNNY